MSPSHKRAEHRVREGVQDDVAVGMSRDAALVWDPHPAEPEVISRREGVHIEAGPDPGDPEVRGAAEATFRVGEIGRVGELDVRRIALEHRDVEAGPFGHARHRP